MLEFLTDLAVRWGFPVLMAALLSSGLGVPIPEDVPLLLTGGQADQPFALVVEPVHEALEARLEGGVVRVELPDDEAGGLVQPLGGGGRRLAGGQEQGDQGDRGKQSDHEDTSEAPST